MSIDVTYTCDRCHRIVEESSDIRIIGLVIQPLALGQVTITSYNTFKGKDIQHRRVFCLSCCEANKINTSYSGPRMDEAPSIKNVTIDDMITDWIDEAVANSGDN